MDDWANIFMERRLDLALVNGNEVSIDTSTALCRDGICGSLSFRSYKIVGNSMISMSLTASPQDASKSRMRRYLRVGGRMGPLDNTVVGEVAIARRVKKATRAAMQVEETSFRDARTTELS